MYLVLFLEIAFQIGAMAKNENNKYISSLLSNNFLD